MTTGALFLSRPETLIDLRHPLAVLVTGMPWGPMEQMLAPLLAQTDRTGRLVEAKDLFGPTVAIAGGGVGSASQFIIIGTSQMPRSALRDEFRRADEVQSSVAHCTRMQPSGSLQAVAGLRPG